MLSKSVRLTTLFCVPLCVLLLWLAVRPTTATVPFAVDDVALVVEDSAVVIPLMLNDSGATSVIGTTPPSHGVLTDNGDNIVTYTPTFGYVGDDSFTYTVSDGSGTDTATVTIMVNATIDGEAVRDALLAGVSTIAGDGYGGRMAAFGPTAYAISHWPNTTNAMVGAASWGQGRVVAVPDHQGFNLDARAGTGDSTQFFLNAIEWAADSADLGIHIVTYTSGNQIWLQSQGFTNVTLTDEAGLATALVSADIFIPSWLGSNESTANLTAIGDFVKAGGGLLLADFGQGYLDWWGKPINEAPGNLLLREAGIAFGSGIAWDSGAVAVNRASGQINSDTLLAMLVDSSGYSADELEEAGAMMAYLYEGLSDDDLLIAQLDQFFWARINTINPTPVTPVDDPFDQALLLREAELLEAIPPYQVTAHRTVTDVYGTIDPATPRINTTVTLDTSRGRWHALGLYAAPGELVTVTVPVNLVGQGYEVRVSAHTDDISPRDSWERPPRVDRAYPIDATTINVAGAFGGSLYIAFNNGAYDAPPNLGNVDVVVEGAVEQPYFVLGQHTDQAWVDTYRDKDAPYAVLVSPNLIINYRSAESATLTEPTALMTWWNAVVSGQDWLASRPTPRTGAELMNIDVQISAGAAHAGFPYQAWDRYWGNPADWDELQANGSWGDFHELGHNQQRGWWTFDGDGEVTVNIFSNYSLETMVANPDSGGWGYSADPIATMQSAISDIAPGGTYSSKSDRWSFWFQLADGFGWDTYQQVLAGYEDDNINDPSALPTSDAEEKDQWLVRWSEQVGWDMKPFMVDAWGLQVSQSAIDQVSALPDWMPVIAPPLQISVIEGMTETVDLEANALSLDGVATLIAVTQPMSGTVINNGDGTVTYSAPNGVYGTTTFGYTLQSSGVNTEMFAVTVEIVPACPGPLIVSASADSGACTLRNAVQQATNGDTITFHPILDKQTITLQSAIVITKDLTIDGGAAGVTLSGGDNTYLFDISSYDDVTLQNLTIRDGRSNTGAIINRWFATLTLNNTTFINNVSTQYAGGAVHSQGYVHAYNSTFSSNSAPSGGGALGLRFSDNFIYNSTFFGNRGGSISADDTGWSLYNSVIASTSGVDCVGEPPTNHAGNWVQDGSCDATNSGDPQLDVLADNGGSTWTHKPLPASPLIDAGDNATCLLIDQRNFPRDDGSCDIGAVEVQTVPTAIALIAAHATPSRLLPILVVLMCLTLIGVAKSYSSRVDSRRGS